MTTGRLLFVDDDPHVLRALRRMFEAEGYEVVTAANGAAGLEALRAGEFQVIGSDYRMPQMNGADFLHQARAVSPQSVRILISAVHEFAAAMEAVNRGAIQRLVAKPWDADELIHVVAEATQTYHLTRRYQEVMALLHARNAELEALNRRLEQRVVEQTTGVLEVLVNALDQHCDEAAHSRRTATLALTLGRRLGLTQGELAILEQGSLLHDVGKLGLSPILLTRQELDEDERRELQRHPEIGYRLLAPIPSLAAARNLVLQHHERWDGKGYPLGLAGEQIDRSARIFHVAEAWTAMISPRSYRQARPLADARAEIERCCGTQFDPQIVAAFVSLTPGELEAAAPRREGTEAPAPDARARGTGSSPPEAAPEASRAPGVAAPSEGD
ncbi:MAG TPA: HD domain-containing phosphohydrolase [Myxococcales bacterium]|nr:HD domain-containing phosphohydrolase [Myxococcales bacterium]